MVRVPIVFIGNFGVVGDKTSWQLAPEGSFIFYPHLKTSKL